ncbi:MAG: NUDIX hydrolase [Planctomycetes bacterium]|nr:NUDIX hydrolase [Planctomycetota bacterium]
MNVPPKSQPTHILAAGGIVRRSGPGGVEIAIVQRRRHGDLSLPKGKVDRGEGLQAAAVREVREETGCLAAIVGPPDFAEYEVGGIPKVVVFFPMDLLAVGAIEDADEVADVVWMTPDAALTRLSYAGERQVLRRMSPPIGG